MPMNQAQLKRGLSRAARSPLRQLTALANRSGTSRFRPPTTTRLNAPSAARPERHSRLQTALAVLPVVTGELYLMGYCFYVGNLLTYGLTDSLFPLGIDRAILFGFLTLISASFEPMADATLAMTALLMVVVVAAALSSTSRVKRWQRIAAARVNSWILSVRSDNKPLPALNNLVDKGLVPVVYFGGTALLIAASIVVAVLSLGAGRKQGTKEIAEFRDRRGIYVSVESAAFPSPVEAKQIVCNASHCAYWLGHEAVVLQHDKVDRVITHNAAFQERGSELERKR
jgi:hypothetical protein